MTFVHSATVVGSLWLYSLQSLGLLTRFPELALSSLLSQSCLCHASIAAAGTSCLQRWYCGFCGPSLGNDAFPLSGLHHTF